MHVRPGLPNPFILLILILYSFLSHAQMTCSSVTAADISSSPAYCEGGGSITAPNLGSSVNYRLTGGNIVGELVQDSHIFDELTAGNYTLTLLCTGEPTVSFPVTVEDRHTLLGLSLNASTVACPSGTAVITSTPSGGYNEGGTGVEYEFAVWSAKFGEANRPESEIASLYSSSNTSDPLEPGVYYVRVRDNCDNFYTQSIHIQPTYPIPGVLLGTPSVTCSGSTYSYSFPSAVLFGDTGPFPASFYSGPNYYVYSLEEIGSAADCQEPNATVLNTLVSNVPITSATTLSSASFSGLEPGHHYRFRITLPCGDETFACFSPQNLLLLNTARSLLCETGSNGESVRVSYVVFSPSGYVLNFPVQLELRYNGTAPTDPADLVLTANNYSELNSMQLNHPASVFPISVTGTDGCGVPVSTDVTIPVAGDGQLPGFDVNYDCVNENGNVNLYVYLTGYWFGLEYNSGPNSDRTMYELVRSSDDAVLQTLYGMSNTTSNVLVFPNVAAGQAYYIRITPPGSVISACAAQETDPFTIQASLGFEFSVTAAVEKSCNNGTYSIQYTIVNQPLGSLTYKLFQGGTLIDETNSPSGLAPGSYEYEIARASTSPSCPLDLTRTGTVNINDIQENPEISRVLSVACQQVGQGPQNTGSVLLTFSGNGPFMVEKSTNGGPYVVVQAAAVNSYSEASLSTGAVYFYRATDQCGKSVSQRVSIKPLSSRVIENQMSPCEGEPYTLSALDFGDPLTEYVWEKVGGSVLGTDRTYTIPNFTSADNGTYKLTITLFGGCVVREAFIKLNSDDCGGPIASGSLGNYVWFDLNSNGIQDEGAASGVSGVQVELESYQGPDANGTPSAADLANPANWGPQAVMVTDATGYYLFDGLSDGWYRVKFGTVPDYGFTTPLQGSDFEVDSDAGDQGYSQPVRIIADGTGIDKDNLTIDAGLVPAGSLGDYVWIDENENGQQDPGEEPKQGVTVNLYDGANVLLATTVTDENGFYIFEGLQTGTYQVEFVKPSGYAFTYTNQAGVPSTLDSDADRVTGRSGLITINTAVDLSGPDAILRRNMTIDAGLVFGELPVKLVAFNVAREESRVVTLRWSTSSETNSDRFEIERSTDGAEWQLLGKVKAATTSETLRSYRFDDPTPSAAVNYYRLRMIDLDNSFEYSPIRSIQGDNTVERLLFYPNPANEHLTVKSENGLTIQKLELFDAAGRRVNLTAKSATTLELNVKELPNGLYVILVHLADGSQETRKIIVKH